MELKKYCLELKYRQELICPIGTKFLSVEIQNSNIYLWAFVDSYAIDYLFPTKKYTIYLIEKSKHIEGDSGKYIFTIRKDDTNLYLFIKEY